MKLSLYYPLKPHYITQKFGETALLSYYNANGVNFKGHNGIDLVSHHGDAIRASHDGEAWYEIDSSQGHGVVIRTNDKFEYGDSGCYFKSIYWHMCDSNKEPQYRSPIELFTDINKAGKQVKAGDIIGYADSTGLSMGDHLHFGLKPVAQNEFNGSFYNAAQENGYNGAIDPVPYFNGQFAEDIQNFFFQIDMKLGDKSEDVKQLQNKLRRLGYFHYPVDTGFYGESTRNAVYAFQLDNVKLGWWAKKVYRGLYCYSNTREALNKFIIN